MAMIPKSSGGGAPVGSPPPRWASRFASWSGKGESETAQPAEGTRSKFGWRDFQRCQPGGRAQYTSRRRSRRAIANKVAAASVIAPSTVRCTAES